MALSHGLMFLSSWNLRLLLCRMCDCGVWNL
jgi:hypothetical protein